MATAILHGLRGNLARRHARAVARTFPYASFPRAWLDGWRRLYPPQSFQGAQLRAVGEARLTLALACVTEDGRRVRPFPRHVPESVILHAREAAREHERRERLALVGV
jgi:hypothetical protein